jgi:hypothetical protein
MEANEAKLILEPLQGSFFHHEAGSTTPRTYLTRTTRLLDSASARHTTAPTSITIMSPQDEHSPDSIASFRATRSGNLVTSGSSRVHHLDNLDTGPSSNGKTVATTWQDMPPKYSVSGKRDKIGVVNTKWGNVHKSGTER